MWQFRCLEIDHGFRYELFQDRQPASFLQFLQGLTDDSVLRNRLIDQLRQVPLPAYKWETPGFSRENAQQPFEFVVINTPELERPQDSTPFHLHFGSSGAGAPVLTAGFSNLSNDAYLIAPKPADTTTDYAHLAAFCRTAEQHQQHALWQHVGLIGQSRQDRRQACWLSTAGEGVAWLHIRFDRHPKYYAYEPYRHASIR